MVMDTSAYLERMAYGGDVRPTAESLAELHLAHLLAVPFENLSIHVGEPIQLRLDWLFDKIVRRRRGGFCYELNGLFAALLSALGFETEMLAARVYSGEGRLGIPFDHTCLRGYRVWIAPRWVSDGGVYVFYPGYWSIDENVAAPAEPEELYVETEPPPPQVEVMPVAPSIHHVWNAGHWEWRERRYVWIPGRWEAARASLHWEAGLWQRDGARWHWRPGRWRKE